jgi:hypothetical protein
MSRLRMMMIGAALVAGSSMIASAQPRDEHRNWGYTNRDHDRDNRSYAGNYYRNRDDDRYDRDDRRKVFDPDDRARHERDQRRDNRWFGDRDNDGDRR